MIDFFLSAGKAKILGAVAWLIAMIAFADWAVGNSFSLGVLYILPMMLGALILRRPETVALAIFCAFLRYRFDTPSSDLESVLRFVFASVSYFTCGLFVSALVRNRQFVAEHLKLMGEHVNKIEREQALRREAEEQLRVLVASSPAAILTLDARRKGVGRE